MAFTTSDSFVASPEAQLRQAGGEQAQQNVSRSSWNQADMANLQLSSQPGDPCPHLPEISLFDGGNTADGSASTGDAAGLSAGAGDSNHMHMLSTHIQAPAPVGEPDHMHMLSPATEATASVGQPTTWSEPSQSWTAISSDATSTAKTPATATDTSTASSTATTSDTTSSIPQSPVPGTGSTDSTFGTSAMPEVSQTAPGFYVSPDGSANGNGSKADPFATLQQAQKAMENSNIKTTYVEGGTYNMSSALNLTSADSGESFISAGGASNPAVLDGGGKLSDLVSLNGANNVNIQGFSMENTSSSAPWDATKHGQVQPNVGAIYAQDSTGDTFSYNTMNNVNVGVNMQGDTDMRVARDQITNAQSGIDTGSDQNNVYGSDNTIQGNLLDNITGYGKQLFDNVGAINVYGDSNSTVDNNVIENTAGVGIQENFRTNGSGFSIANNTILNTDDIANYKQPDTNENPVGDNGGIHIIVSPGSSKMLNGIISDNYVNGAGVNKADKAIYLDDGVNGVTVTGNVLNEGGEGDAMQVHGGHDNTIEDNTFYLGAGRGILYQTDGYQMTGNIVEDNDFIKSGTGTQAYEFSGTDSGDTPIFSGNEYSQRIEQSPDPDGTTS